MRRLAVLLASVLAVTACASPEKPTVEQAEGAEGEVAVTDDASLPDPGEPGSASGPGSAEPGGAGQPGGPSTSAGATPNGATGGGASASATEAAAALDTYLDALAAEQYRNAMDASSGGPRLLAFSRAMFKTNNDAQGVKLAFTYRERSFQPASAEAARVTFKGRAVLDGKTRTPDGKEHATAVTIADPTVQHLQGKWLVTDYILDGKTVVLHRGQSKKVHGGRPVTVYLVGALSYGDVTGVIIEFDAEKDFEVLIEDDLLIRDDRTSSTFRIIAGRYVYFSYPRKDQRPTQWQAAITVDKAWKDFIPLPF